MSVSVPRHHVDATRSKLENDRLRIIDRGTEDIDNHRMSTISQFHEDFEQYTVVAQDLVLYATELCGLVHKALSAIYLELISVEPA